MFTIYTTLSLSLIFEIKFARCILIFLVLVTLSPSIILHVMLDSDIIK